MDPTAQMKLITQKHLAIIEEERALLDGIEQAIALRRTLLNVQEAGHQQTLSSLEKEELQAAELRAKRQP